MIGFSGKNGKALKRRKFLASFWLDFISKIYKVCREFGRELKTLRIQTSPTWCGFRRWFNFTPTSCINNRSLTHAGFSVNYVWNPQGEASKRTPYSNACSDSIRILLRMVDNMNDSNPLHLSVVIIFIHRYTFIRASQYIIHSTTVARLQHLEKSDQYIIGLLTLPVNHSLEKNLYSNSVLVVTY